MSNDSAKHGPSLYRFLADYWRATGTNQNAWCDRHPGIQAPTVSRWQKGTEPSLAHVRAIAEAIERDGLGCHAIDVVQAAGLLTAAEAGRAPTQPAPPSVDAALELDTSVPEDQRRMLRDVLAGMRAVEAGKAQEVSVSTSRARRTRAK